MVTRVVTRKVTRGNTMQHGLKTKIWHARMKKHKIYFQMSPNLIYFGWYNGELGAYKIWGKSYCKTIKNAITAVKKQLNRKIKKISNRVDAATQN